MKIYELTNQIDEIYQLIESGEVAEEDLRDTLESLQMEINDKISGLADLYTNLCSDADKITAEGKRLAERANAITKKADRIKEYISFLMDSFGKTELNTTRHRITYRPSVGMKKLAPEEKAGLIKWLIENGKTNLYSTSYSPLDGEIRKAIEAGEEIPFAVIEQRKNIQIK